MKKRKSEHHCSIQHIRISLDTKFQLKQTTLIFWNQIYPKRVVWSETNIEHHHRIQYIRITSPGIEFHVKQTIWFFLTKCTQMVSFGLKQKKLNHGWGNVSMVETDKLAISEIYTKYATERICLFWSLFLCKRNSDNEKISATFSFIRTLYYLTNAGYHYCTTSFIKAWTHVLRRFKSCSRWWESLIMVPVAFIGQPYHKNNSSSSSPSSMFLGV